jgi:hypothetical protein
MTTNQNKTPNSFRKRLPPIIQGQLRNELSNADVIYENSILKRSAPTAAKVHLVELLEWPLLMLWTPPTRRHLRSVY